MVEQTVSIGPVIEWLNSYSGALTVIITLVYVAATILIWLANYKSAQATHDQLEESKRQFEETKKANQQQLEAMRLQLEESKRQYEETRRLDVMPYLQFEASDQLANVHMKLDIITNDATKDKATNKYRVKNIGHGTAKDISYIYEAVGCYELPKPRAFPIKALQHGDAQHLKIDFVLPSRGPEGLTVALNLEFSDLLEHRYKQRIEFSFKQIQTDAYTRIVADPQTFSPVLLE